MRVSLFLITTFFFTSCNYKDAEKINSPRGFIQADSSGENLYETDAEDLEMNNAIKKATTELSIFENALKSKNEKLKNFMLKKRYSTTNGGEHIWIGQIKLFNDGFMGIVNNDPELTKEVQYGDTVYVDKQDITDWSYLDNNVLQGGYTVKVELKRMPVKERLAYLKSLEFTIKE